MVGRVEVRDWVDTMEATTHVQPLGYLAWAASGKDPGFGPLAILESAARFARYSAAEVEALEFDGSAPDAAELATRWRRMLEEAREVVRRLPAKHAGCCVLDRANELYVGDAASLEQALERDELRFHPGRLGGALPDLMANGEGGTA